MASPPSNSSIASGLADDDSSPPRFPDAPQPASYDWEVLSMSTMSASTMGLPLQQPSESDHTDDLADEKKKSEGLVAEAMAGSDTAFPSGHGEGDADAHIFDIQPFTEGWRTHLRPTESGVPFQENYSGSFPSAEGDMEPLVGLRHEELLEAEETPERSISPVADAGNAPKKKACKVSWWNCQTVLWGPGSQKSSTVWSIALAAAVVGIVIIGHRWHRERYQNQQLKLDLSAKEEKLNDLMYQVNRMKEAMTGRRRVGVTRNSFF